MEMVGDGWSGPMSMESGLFFLFFLFGLFGQPPPMMVTSHRHPLSALVR